MKTYSIPILIVLALALTFFACGSNSETSGESDPSDDASDDSVDDASDDSTDDTTAEPDYCFEINRYYDTFCQTSKLTDQSVHDLCAVDVCGDVYRDFVDQEGPPPDDHHVCQHPEYCDGIYLAINTCPDWYFYTETPACP